MGVELEGGPCSSEQRPEVLSEFQFTATVLAQAEMFFQLDFCNPIDVPVEVCSEAAHGLCVADHAHPAFLFFPLGSAVRWRSPTGRAL